MSSARNSLTVGFDVTWMNANNTAGGVFQYAERLISSLVKYTDIDIVAIVSNNAGDTFKNLLEYQNFKTILLDSRLSFIKAIEKSHVNVIHTPIQFHMNYTVSVPMIITLHDLQHFHYPDYFTEKNIQFRNIFYKRSAEFSERIIVSYDHIREDVIRFYNISHDKIDVCPFGTEPPKSLMKADFPAVKKKYKISEHYLFYSANTWEHKNHLNLIKALKILHDKYGHKICLICTGNKMNFFPVIKKEIEKHHLNVYVKFLGYIPEKELLLIMSNATLVVIPTLYEAGSFPLIEAMTYEVPVICSNVTSLPDQIGDKRFIFDPYNIEQIANKINLMLADSKLMDENRENSKRQIELLKWESKVGLFVDSYRKAIVSFGEKKREKTFVGLLDNYEYFMNDYYQKHLNSLQNSRTWKIISLMKKLKKLLKINQCVLVSVMRNLFPFKF